jgi:anti-sigma factor RsiW
MCDKERLVSYLYEDLPDAERAVFERHVRDCDDCRAELNALRGVRADLISWSPPQPDFGFRVVREPKVLPMPQAWRAWWTPAAGLAAAAVLVLAAASAIARVEVRSGPDGFTVRTGWPSASAPATEQGFGATPSRAVSARGDMILPASTTTGDASMESLIEAMDRRLRALEVAARDAGPVRYASASENDVLRRMRELLAQSETKQQGELALRIAQVLKDVDAQRVEDLRRIQQGLRGIEATVTAEAAGHRELTNYILTSSNSKQK